MIILTRVTAIRELPDILVMIGVLMSVQLLFLDFMLIIFVTGNLI